MKKTFKKMMVLLLIVAFAFCLFACNKDEQKPEESNDSTVAMTESYERGRAEFKAVTGIELPALADITVEEFPYEEGATSYELDITAGVTRDTFDVIVAFLNTALASWTKEGPTTDGEYTNIWWRSNDGSIGITWDDHNTAVYVHAIMSSSGPQPSEDPTDSDVNMTASYKEGRKSFYQISGLLLPALENVELSDESVFDAQKKEAQFVVANNNVFASMVQAVKTALADEPLSDNNKHWEQEGFMAFWEWDYEADGRMHKVTIQLENNTYTGKVTVGYWFRDYYTITLTATAGGSAELDISGRAQSGNTAHVCYNTSSDLIATAPPGYRFVGFYEGEALLSAENPYEGYMIVKDVTIEARFEEIPSSMTEGYKTARNNLYAMSGIVLPALDGVTTDHETYDFDNEDHVRDEFNCDFTFASAEAAAQAFADFSAAIALVDGNAEESGETDAIWSKLYEDAVIPYRDDVMMFAGGTSVFLMWRKQPIAFYNVTVEGEGGTADIVYVGANYEDVRVQRHWEIVDAFGGRIVATPAQGYEFDGWYVNGQLVSEDADYRFRLSSEKTAPVDFTEITFVAKFVEVTVQMTESYAQARSSFETVSGLVLPELAEVVGTIEDCGAFWMLDINGSTNDTFVNVKAAFTTQIGSTSTLNEQNVDVWDYSTEDDGTTYACQVRCFFDSGIVVVMYEKTAVTANYMSARTQFAQVTGITLPLVGGIGPDPYYAENVYQVGDTEYMLDLTEGDALSSDTFNKFKAFFDDLDGWYYSHLNEDGNYHKYYYYKPTATGYELIEVIWDSDNEWIFINAGCGDPSVAIICNNFYVAKQIFLGMTGIDLPSYSTVTIEDNSFANGRLEITFAFSGVDYDNFTATEAVFTEKFGAPANRDENDGYVDTTWTVSDKMYSVSWDPNDYKIDINIG